MADKIPETKKLRTVWENIYTPIMKKTFPEIAVFDCEGVRVLIIHIGGYPGKYNTKTKDLIKQYKPKIVICGHSHILKVMRDKTDNHLHINPGAAGVKGFHKIRTMIRLKIENGRIFDVEAIELASPTLKELNN